MNSEQSRQESVRIKQLDDKSARVDFLEGLNDPSSVVFVGSAISLFAPSNIPAGQIFAREMRRELLLAGMIPAGEAPRIELLLGRIPFEVWLHYARLVVPSIRVRDLVAELASAVQPNAIHRFVAEFLTAGGTVVTPNYDALIELAAVKGARPGLNPRLIESGLQDAGIARVYDKRQLAADKPPGSPQEGLLLKLHGSVDDPASLVFELRQEARLDSWKADLLQRLTHGRHVYFVATAEAISTYYRRCFAIRPAGLRGYVGRRASRRSRRKPLISLLALKGTLSSGTWDCYSRCPMPAWGSKSTGRRHYLSGSQPPRRRSGAA